MKLTVDAVIFTLIEKKLNILLIKRKYPPFSGCLALPGGYVTQEETTENAVLRELEEETGVHVNYLEQLYTFSDINRDPRGRTVSVSYFGLVNPINHSLLKGDEADSVGWYPVYDVNSEDYAFDHDRIVLKGLERLQAKIRYQPIGFELLDDEFTLPQVHRLFSAIIGYEVDKRNLFKQVKNMDFIVPLKKHSTAVSTGRKAKLYRFDEKKYEKAIKKGLKFWI